MDNKIVVYSCEDKIHQITKKTFFVKYGWARARVLLGLEKFQPYDNVPCMAALWAVCILNFLTSIHVDLKIQFPLQCDVML